MVLMADAPRDVAPVLPDASSLTSNDRDLAIARLSDAFAQDVLPVEEFERRLDAVYLATDRAQLDRLVHDVPPVARAGSYVMPESRPSVTQRVRSVFSSVERRGVHDIPSRLELRATFANMELDLRHARFGDGVTEISVHAVFANVELLLPPGSRVYDGGTGILANFACATDAYGHDDGPTVRVTGWAVASNVEVTCAPASSRLTPPTPSSAMPAIDAIRRASLPDASRDVTPNPMPPYRP